MNFSLSSEEKERYNRQLILKGFGEDAQAKLKNSAVLVVGAGGLGSPALLYLATAGVGKLGIIDGDSVSLSNLQRQLLYRTEDVGNNKSEIAKEILRQKNPNVHIGSYPFFLDVDNCLSVLEKFDVVIDASDNFETRYLLNDACVILKKPLIYASLFAFEGQISVFNYQDGPTLRCLFPEIPERGIIDNCADNGVLGVLPGLMGVWQAQEAIKMITGIGEVLSGKLLVFNMLNNESRLILFKVDEKNKLIKNLAHFNKSVKNTNPEIDSPTLNAWLAQETLQLIDVREHYEFEESNIGGINIPISLLEGQSVQLNKNKKTVVICQSGIRSQMACKILRQIFKEMEIYHLKGGLNSYLL